MDQLADKINNFVNALTRALKQTEGCPNVFTILGYLLFGAVSELKSWVDYVLDNFLDLMDFVVANFWNVSQKDVDSFIKKFSDSLKEQKQELPPELKDMSETAIYNFLRDFTDELHGIRNWKETAKFKDVQDLIDQLGKKAEEMGGRLRKHFDRLQKLPKQAEHGRPETQQPLNIPPAPVPDAVCVLKYGVITAAMVGLLLFATYSWVILPYQTTGTLTYNLISGTDVVRLDVTVPQGMEVPFAQAPQGWNLAPNYTGKDIGGFTLTGGGLKAGNSLIVSYTVAGAVPPTNWTALATHADGSRSVTTTATQFDATIQYVFAGLVYTLRLPLQALFVGLAGLFSVVTFGAAKWSSDAKGRKWMNQSRGFG